MVNQEGLGKSDKMVKKQAKKINTIAYYKLFLAVVMIMFTGILCVNLVSGAEGDYIDSFDILNETTNGEALTITEYGVLVVSTSPFPNFVYNYTMAGENISRF